MPDLPDIPAIWLTGGSLFALLVAVAWGTIAVVSATLAEREHRAKAAGMPSFQELGAARASLEEARRQIAEEAERLDDIRRQVAERERDRVDTQHWRSLVEETKREYESLSDMAREIDRIREQFEDAAKDLAARRQEVADKAAERDRLAGEVGRLTRQRDEADDLTKQIEEKETRLGEIRRELATAGNEIEDRRQARFDVERLESLKGALENAIKELPQQVDALHREKSSLESELADLRAKEADLRSLRDKIDRLTDRKGELEAAIQARDTRKEELTREIENLQAKRDAATTTGGGIAQVEASLVLEDLQRPPSCLFHDADRHLPEPFRNADEEEMLDRVRKHLADLELRFDPRIIKRFHTCLKTSRISPLTVLAGISGTGKSLLPERYAEAMGIHFLKLPVQPRWDSPQDLLGFYNYLEQRYKATDLARALVRMEERSTLIPQDESTSDRVLLILLDEMNLARIEYYFSEFLSRLEGRPEPGVDDEERLRSGRIEIDIPSQEQGHQPLGIYPGHNVLFAGTMNEDESTQSLSGKVLDRANMIRFPRPKDLVAKVTQGAGRRADRFLPFETWKAWHRDPDALGEANNRIINGFVDDLNDQLEVLKHPFAHRIAQAIYSYAANHPDFQTEAGVRTALADMLELRILPKLRGVDLQNNERVALQRIQKMAEDRLGEPDLGKRIENNIRGTDMFTWTG